MYVFALAGNPNCGKTTLFNTLTGSHRAAGNRTGVTVDIKEGACRYDKSITITDLPGIYSLSPQSAEEAIAREYIEGRGADLILNIADCTNLERNLYLTLQLIETGVPVVLVLNMTDALLANGMEVDCRALEKQLCIPVVPISAKNGTGINILLERAYSLLQSNKSPLITSYATPEERYAYIHKLVSRCVKIIGTNKSDERTQKIDAIVNHPVFAIPIFCVVMLAVFQITFGSFGKYLSSLADSFFNNSIASIIRNCLDVLGAGSFVKGIIIDGAIAGVGSVVTFFPQIMLLFLFLSFLEDSGYMARAAFIMDRLLAKLGLSGKSVVPMIMGFGCSVPAIMAARTLENERDRRLTMLLVPFMSCGAKMPVYALFAAALFPNCAGIVIFSLYMLGIFFAVVSGIIFSRTIFKGSPPPFVLELPPYRMPTLRTTLNHVWTKTKDFALRAGTVIFTASIIMWLAQNLDFSLHMVSDSSASIIGAIGKFIAPIFIPCGFGNPEAAVSLLSGFAAKEAILSSLAVLTGMGGTAQLTRTVAQTFTPIGAYSFMVFVLLYVPCLGAVSALSKELNSKRLTAFSVIYQLFIAWTVSAAVFCMGNLFMV